MHQATLISSGERNYTRLVGHNGPLVYPAGHAWIHFALHQLTLGQTALWLSSWPWWPTSSTSSSSSASSSGPRWF